MGIFTMPGSGAFVSISDAGTLKVCENGKGQVINQVSPSKLNGGKEMALKAMINLTSRNLLAVADALGNIYLMDTSTTDLEIVKVLSIETGA
jgi:WD40 repeat protein